MAAFALAAHAALARGEAPRRLWVRTHRAVAPESTVNLRHNRTLNYGRYRRASTNKANAADDCRRLG
jgi:hypothetical protein